MDDLVERIIEILTAEVKTARGIKQIYDGDIYLIPHVSMPAIVVQGTQNAVANTSENISVYDLTQIDIILVQDALDYLNGKFTENTANKVARKIIEERDTNFKYKSDTITGALQMNLDNDSTRVLKIMRTDVKYSQIIVRGTGEQPYPVIETTVSVVIQTKNYNRV